MPHHVFTYGSLMFAPVWERVVTAVYRSSPADLTGYRRFAIVGETYPGIMETEAGALTGVLYFDVNDADLQALDDFEGGDYQRRAVQVTMQTGAPLTAQTYVYLLPERLATHDWDVASFPITRFMQTYCRGRPGDPVFPAPHEPV